MTIIAGFRCPDGIVICSDTQQTVDNFSKRKVSKVRMFPNQAMDEPSDFGMVICGSGKDSFVELITRKIWDIAKGATSLARAAEDVELRIKGIYKEYGLIYQAGYCPSVELIYGMKMGGETMLFHADGPTVNEVREYRSAGAGVYLADFLQAKMGSGSLTVNQCAVLAAYILFQAKEHVDGCGGDSHIAVLAHDGRNGFVDEKRIRSWNDLLVRVDDHLGNILLACANLKDRFDVELAFKSAMFNIDWLRDKAQKEIFESDRLLDYFSNRTMSLGEALTPPPFINRDELGFVVTPEDTK